MARWLQTMVAAGGGAAGAFGVAAAVAGQGPAPAWLLWLFAGWCVATPYWWYLEYRLLCPADPRGRREFRRRQSYSRLVWLGFALAMALPILARAGGAPAIPWPGAASRPG